MKNQVITGTVDAWITAQWIRVSDLRTKPGAETVGHLSYTNQDMSDHQGWFKVGKATISVTLDDDEAVTACQVESLNRQLQTVRAENHQREKRITDAIANLTALTFTTPTKENHANP